MVVFFYWTRENDNIIMTFALSTLKNIEYLFFKNGNFPQYGIENYIQISIHFINFAACWHVHPQHLILMKRKQPKILKFVLYVIFWWNESSEIQFSTPHTQWKSLLV